MTIDLPAVAAVITAAGGLLLGLLGHRMSKRQVDSSSLDAHLTALRDMYKEFVNDLRLEIDRLHEENAQLRKTVNELESQLRKAEVRERQLGLRLEAAEQRLMELGNAPRDADEA